MIKHRIPAMSTIGQTFGRLTVERLTPFVKYKNGSTKARVECRCSCGNYCTVLLQHLKSGKTKSCGCITKERLKARKGQPRYVYTYNEGDTLNDVMLRRYAKNIGHFWYKNQWRYTPPHKFRAETRIPIARARALFPAAFGLPTPTKPVESVS